MKINKDYRKFIKFVAIILILIGVYSVGYGVGHENLSVDKNYKPQIINIDNGKDKDIDFSIFWDAWNIVKTSFVKKDIDFQKMVYGAISGMVNSLRDPYSMFMTPEESENLMEDMDGAFGGIGVEITFRDGYLVIVSPIEDSPADHAGIRSKDIILKIDGVDVTEYTFAEAINKIRGEKGTDVTLTVMHQDEQEAVDIKVTRDTIIVDSVKWEVKNNDVMYIRITQFGDDTYELLEKVVDEIQAKNINKVIVDVRDNPGGFLTESVDVTSLFIPEGIVVYEEDRNGDKTGLKTTYIPRLEDKKIVILVNGGSASASEIFAGALQDNKKGTLVGETTFGKGSVQNLEELDDGSTIKITIAKWLTPNQRIIEGEGITPDIEIKMSPEDIENDRDPQLDKALEIVNQ